MSEGKAPAEEYITAEEPAVPPPDPGDYSVVDSIFGAENDYYNEYLQTVVDDGEEELEHDQKPFSYFDLLDRPRYLPEPVDLTEEHLKQINYELGLINLCWPEITDPFFEDRTNFPASYLSNTNKEKLLLLYTENFRQQFCYKYPNRLPLFLACENECGMQKMVCTTIRPTTLPYNELQSWEELIKFAGDHLKYEPLEEPTLM
ncbi:hypothetical protein NQ315_007023, partial [Exocentrus adspersus]